MSDKSPKRKQKAKEKRKQEPDKQDRKLVQPAHDAVELQELNDEDLKDIEGGFGQKWFDAGR